MSGHSHWSTIKHKKEIADKKRGEIFSKLSRMITIAAREGGDDPEVNPQLRLAIEKAKEFNFPKENIKKAIQKGAGEAEGRKLERVIYEAYGPGKTAIIIEGITDNKNRTLAEINQILNQHGGKLADPGSVKWMFERKGAITINFKLQTPNFKTKEELELKAIEAGAEDIYWHGDKNEPRLDIYTRVEDLEKVKRKLENLGIEIESASLDWVAKQQIDLPEIEKRSCQKLFEDLDESEAVQDIYSNLKT